jgi:hypothetical protein
MMRAHGNNDYAACIIEQLKEDEDLLHQLVEAFPTLLGSAPSVEALAAYKDCM